MMKKTFCSALLVLFLVSMGSGTGRAQSTPSPAEVRAIAKEAYIYGFPMVQAYLTMYAFSIDKSNSQYKGPFNAPLSFARVFTPEDTAFVTPNSDTPYTFLSLDLRAEPIVITIPPVEKNRYWVFQMMDLYTFNFDYIGMRTTGNKGGTFLVAGPLWKGTVPPGITKVLRPETEFINVVGRTQLFNAADLENVKKIQAKYKAQPLSAFWGKPAPPAAPAIDWIRPVPPREMRTSLYFFNVMNFLLQFCPTQHSETELRARFASIGIAPGKTIDFNSLSPEMTAGWVAGMANGQKEIDARRAASGGNISNFFGTRAFLHGDYVARATGAQMGIGANSKEEALYPLYEKDADGQALDGSKARYTLHFAKGLFPPVNAFWSLTLYNLPQQLLVKNPINRYLINSPMMPDLKLDSDGGLTMYIQADSPGKDREANWLPAPKAPFMLAMRYYLPKQELLDGSWKSPQVQRVK
ncbi:hypothetical protein EDE15_2405 [Edaphobacter aggregans]|uniref:Cell envelope protein n=1 Tax=Edaphobacter aggregans TaxID=570835 RepID=A0A3R9QA26_9BACT|nr:DUF1254 domain-containing protein [Edaphobacter aggregans]RSL16879.1 hypothetical protein EDE15_2405 [Edaphobacter aggregans]